MKRNNRRLIALSSVIVASVTSMACASAPSLSRLVESDAPGFRVKAPAIGDHQLGEYLLGDQVSATRCFDGSRQTATYPSWSERKLSYTGTNQLKIDFGSVLQFGGKRTRKVDITLVSVSVVALTDLHALGCADLTESGSTEDRQFRIITQALVAQAISIESADTLDITVDTLLVGGYLDIDDHRYGSWKGVNLYFADLPQGYSVSQAHHFDTLSVGNTIDIGSCGFTLRSVDSQGWTGNVSCRSVKGDVKLAGAPGDYRTENMGGGISVSVRLTQPRLKQGFVDIYRFSVTPTRD